MQHAVCQVREVRLPVVVMQASPVAVCLKDLSQQQNIQGLVPAVNWADYMLLLPTVPMPLLLLLFC